MTMKIGPTFGFPAFEVDWPESEDYAGAEGLFEVLAGWMAAGDEPGNLLGARLKAEGLMRDSATDPSGWAVTVRGLAAYSFLLERFGSPGDGTCADEMAETVENLLLLAKEDGVKDPDEDLGRKWAADLRSEWDREAEEYDVKADGWDWSFPPKE